MRKTHFYSYSTLSAIAEGWHYQRWLLLSLRKLPPVYARHFSSSSYYTARWCQLIYSARSIHTYGPRAEKFPAEMRRNMTFWYAEWSCHFIIILIASYRRRQYIERHQSVGSLVTLMIAPILFNDTTFMLHDRLYFAVISFKIQPQRCHNYTTVMGYPSYVATVNWRYLIIGYHFATWRHIKYYILLLDDTHKSHATVTAC